MIIRAAHDKANPFFQMLRATAQDTKLPARALGVLVYLLSKPDTWEPTIEDICRRFSDVGRDQAYKIIAEIFIPLRYARRRQERKDGKIARWTMDVSETPLPENQQIEQPDTDFQDPDFPHAGIQDPGFQDPGFQDPGFQDPGYHILKTRILDNIDKTKQRRKTKQRTEKTEHPVAIAPGAGLNQQQCYVLFVELWKTAGSYDAPYQNKRADFIQMSKTLKTYAEADWPITRERFEQAARNYFATPQSTHTLADLAAHFSDFFKHPFDRFGKPVEANGRDASMSFLTPAAQKTVAAAEAWLRREEEKEGL